jgi:hypothetical protein
MYWMLQKTTTTHGPKLTDVFMKFSCEDDLYDLLLGSCFLRKLVVVVWNTSDPNTEKQLGLLPYEYR